MRNVLVAVLVLCCLCSCTDEKKQAEQTRFSNEIEAKRKASEILSNVQGELQLVKAGGWENPHLYIELQLENNNQNVFWLQEADIEILDETGRHMYLFQTDTKKQSRKQNRIDPGKTKIISYEFPFSARYSLHQMHSNDDNRHWYFLEQNEVENLKKCLDNKTWSGRLIQITGGKYGDPDVPLSVVSVTPDAKWMYSVIQEVNPIIPPVQQ